MDFIIFVLLGEPKMKHSFLFCVLMHERRNFILHSFYPENILAKNRKSYSVGNSLCESISTLSWFFFPFCSRMEMVQQTIIPCSLKIITLFSIPFLFLKEIKMEMKVTVQTATETFASSFSFLFDLFLFFLFYLSTG